MQQGLLKKAIVICFGEAAFEMVTEEKIRKKGYDTLVYYEKADVELIGKVDQVLKKVYPIVIAYGKHLKNPELGMLKEKFADMVFIKV